MAEQKFLGEAGLQVLVDKIKENEIPTIVVENDTNKTLYQYLEEQLGVIQGKIDIWMNEHPIVILENALCDGTSILFEDDCTSVLFLYKHQYMIVSDTIMSRVDFDIPLLKPNGVCPYCNVRYSYADHTLMCYNESKNLWEYYDLQNLSATEFTAAEVTAKFNS